MIVCADDFGLRGDIDRAIIELCSMRKLSAVSCMALFQRCSAESLRPLLALRDRIDLGLHLCLTQESPALSPREGPPPLLFSSYASCVRRALRRKTRLEEIMAEIGAQYRLFELKCGAPPDYVDGHLHIHQAPGVRKALIRFILSLPEKRRPYIRNTHLPLRRLRLQRLPLVKAGVIGRFGKRMAVALRKARLRTNDGFAGLYDFERARPFREYLPRFLNCLDNRTGILVVHPGHEEKWRAKEFEALRDFLFSREPNRFEP